jgi:hypothetical protein
MKCASIEGSLNPIPYLAVWPRTLQVLLPQRVLLPWHMPDCYKTLSFISDSDILPFIVLAGTRRGE